MDATPVCAPARAAALSLELRPVVAAHGARAGDDGAVAHGGGLTAPEDARGIRRRERNLPRAPCGAETPARRDELALPPAPSRHEEQDDTLGREKETFVIYSVSGTMYSDRKQDVAQEMEGN